MNFLSARQTLLLVAVFLLLIAPSAAQERLKVGETKTLYFPSSITSKVLAGKPGCWSNWDAAVSVTSSSYSSVTIRANAVTDNRYAIIRVDYYYNELFNNYMYQRVGAYDYRVYVDATASTGISVNPTALTLEVGKTEAISATISPSNATNQRVTWSSNNASIASVNSGGIVNAIKIGTAAITATTEDGGKTATCTVTVKAAASKPTAVSIPNSMSLVEGYSSTLTPTLNPDDAKTTYTWTSGDQSIATVSTSGKITAKAPGTAKITVTTANSLTATCTLTVTKSSVNTQPGTISAKVSKIQSLIQRTIQRVP